MAEPVFLNDCINQNNPNEAKHLIKKLKPEWKNDDLVVQKLTGGYVNVLLCVHLSTDKERENALVIRIFAEEEPQGHTNDTEIQNLQIAQHLGLSPDLVAIFENGIIYKFIPGRTLVFADLFDPEIVSKQMEILAKFHSADPEKMQFYDRKGQPCQFRKIFHAENVQTTINTTREEIPDRGDIPSLQGLIGRKALADEWERIATQLELRNMPMTLNHTDFHTNNLIYHNGILTLIDYPAMSFTYEGYDLGYLFSGYDFLLALGRIQEDQEVLGDDLRLSYCRSYLQHKMALSCNQPPCVSEEQIVAFKADCDAMQALSTFCSLCTLMANHGTENFKFDIRRMCQVAAECYQRKKLFLFT